MIVTSLARTASVLLTLLALIGCVSMNQPKSTGADAPPPTQLEPPAAAGTFSGIITGGNFAKGFGFSNMNLKLFVTNEQGEKVTFFVRSDSKVIDAGGKELQYLEAKGGYGKKVQIDYFIIQDSTGGEPGRSDFSYEIGHRGVAVLRFLN